jgi:fucose permease
MIVKKPLENRIKAQTPMSRTASPAPVVPSSMLLPFILVTILFPLWGFANDITNPMVAAFKNILLLTNFESSWVQAAFYGGYALMAIPAAIFIKKFSYKSGILIGLALYSIGCLLFIPSGMSLSFLPFLLAYLIMTCGLSFLETTANPYVLSMGDESTATRRLNLAQAFNPMGSIIGMFVASMFILVNLDGTSENGRRALKAASEGVPVHNQVVGSSLESSAGLEAILSNRSFETSRRLLKKAMEESRALSQTLDVLADPQPEVADEISAALAAQPVANKFAVAVEAVAVVLQLRDKIQPTAAEARRDQVFHGPGGLELALMLGKEKEWFAGVPGFAESRDALANVAAPARDAAALLKSFYESGRADVEGVREVLGKLGMMKGALSAAEGKLKEMPAASISSHATGAGDAFKAIQKSDLAIVVWPYALMGGILILVLALFAWKLPKDISHEGDHEIHLMATLGRLFHNRNYLFGVIAQTFYVGAQIMVWTFIVQYAVAELGVSKSTAQNCNILAMVIFVSSRFICTFLLHYIKPGKLLALLAIGGLVLTLGAIFVPGYGGLYSLIGISACMSLMFPTIYGIALDGLGDDAKLGSAGLILAIGGGCLMPPLQALIIDLPPVNLGLMELASVRASFFMPALCFVVIAVYGLWVNKPKMRTA